MVSTNPESGIFIPIKDTFQKPKAFTSTQGKAIARAVTATADFGTSFVRQFPGAQDLKICYPPRICNVPEREVPNLDARVVDPRLLVVEPALLFVTDMFERLAGLPLEEAMKRPEYHIGNSLLKGLKSFIGALEGNVDWQEPLREVDGKNRVHFLQRSRKGNYGLLEINRLVDKDYLMFKHFERAPRISVPGTASEDSYVTEIKLESRKASHGKNVLDLKLQVRKEFWRKCENKDKLVLDPSQGHELLVDLVLQPFQRHILLGIGTADSIHEFINSVASDLGVEQLYSLPADAVLPDAKKFKFSKPQAKAA